MFSPRSVTTATLPRVGRCFRTGPDGRIGIVGNWSALLREAHRVGQIALQTRHAFARIVAFTALPDFSAEPDRGFIRSETGSLHCCFQRWHRAWGWLRQCECCGSPGRVQIHNATGAEFMQFTAAPGSEAEAWSDFLAAVSDRDASPSSAENGGEFILPRLVSAHARAAFDPHAFFMLLRAFGDERLPLRFTVRTAEIAHRRDLVPSTVLCDESLLHAGEAGASVQLALPAVRSLAVTSDVNGLALHAVGEAETVLLTISGAFDPIASAAWQGALGRAFPDLR